MNDCDAAVLFNVYIYLVSVGEGWLALVPSHLPHLRELSLWRSDNVCDKHLEELVAAVPELEVIMSNQLDRYVLREMRKEPGNYL